MAQIRKRGRGFTISVYLGEGPDGKKRFYHETFYGTKVQARVRAAELEAELKKDRLFGPKPKGESLGEYLDRWLERVKGTVSERTWETYEWHVRRLKEAIGGLPLAGLTAGQLQDALAALEGTPLTRKKIIGTLKTALRRAVAWGDIQDDPTKGLLLPRVPRKRYRVLAREDWVKLLEAAKGLKHYPLIRLLAVTGMRLGEALGLKWADVDFERGTVTVRRSVDVRKRRFKPEGDETKTPASERTVRLDRETLDVLAALKREQARGRVAFLRQEDALVFGDGTRPMSEVKARLALKRALKRAGLPDIRLHDLRHTVASLLLDAGVSVTTVADLLGHSTPATTVGIYAHAVRGGRSAVDLLRSDKNSDKPERPR